MSVNGSIVNRPYRCLFSTETGPGADIPKAPTTPSPKPATPTSSTDAASDDNTKYQSGDAYFGHNEQSFYDYEVDMASKRVGQPSSKSK